MSIAGSLDPLDTRNKLITYAIDIIKKLKPKYIMLENVPMQLVTKIKYKKFLCASHISLAKTCAAPLA